LLVRVGPSPFKWVRSDVLLLCVAGNVLVMPEAHLFGRLTPCHAELVVSNVNTQGHVEVLTKEIYRGCMLAK
jgi:hypothetical protein